MGDEAPGRPEKWTEPAGRALTCRGEVNQRGRVGKIISADNRSPQGRALDDAHTVFSYLDSTTCSEDTIYFLMSKSESGIQLMRPPTANKGPH
jgi:hypothetical protein